MQVNRKFPTSRLVLSFGSLVILILASGNTPSFTPIHQARLKTLGPENSNQRSLITEYPLNQSQAYPLGLAVDSRGNLWFGETNSDAIIEFLPQSQSFRSFHIPVSPQLVWVWTPVFDNNGNLWFTTTNGSVIWRLNPSNGQFANFSTGNPTTIPYNLAFDSVSNTIWFVSLNSSQFGDFRLNGNGAQIQSIYDIPTNGPGPIGSSDIALDQQGNVYIADSFVGQILKFSTADGSLEHVYTLPKGSQPLGLAIDQATDAIWFTNHGSSFFGYVNQTSGVVTEFSTSTITFKGSYEVTLPYWIQISSSGMIWFNEHIGNKIARFDPSNYELTEFSVPTPSSEPIKFILDNQRGLVWFSEFTGNKIGMLEQNSSLQSNLFLSSQKLTLSGNSVSLTASTSSNGSLVFSSTASITGEIGDNFTISTSAQGSSQSITINRGSSLQDGTYQLTICTSSASPLRTCRIAFINVKKQSSFFSQYEIEIAIAAIAVTLGLSLYFVLKWNRRAS